MGEIRLPSTSRPVDDNTNSIALEELNHDHAPAVVEPDEWTYPEGGLEAWKCVLGSFMLMVPSFGFLIAGEQVFNIWI